MVREPASNHHSLSQHKAPTLAHAPSTAQQALLATGLHFGLGRTLSGHQWQNWRAACQGATGQKLSTVHWTPPLVRHMPDSPAMSSLARLILNSHDMCKCAGDAVCQEDQDAADAVNKFLAEELARACRFNKSHSCFTADLQAFRSSEHVDKAMKDGLKALDTYAKVYLQLNVSALTGFKSRHFLTAGSLPLMLCRCCASSSGLEA